MGDRGNAVADNGVDMHKGGTRAGGGAPLAVMVTATVAGAALRLFRLDGQALWLDEVSSLRNAHAFARGGLTGLAQADQVAPLHSIALWMAGLLGGDGAASLRMPSAIAGVLLIPLIYLIGVRVAGSRWTGAIAAVLVAISPYAIWYAQEARMYALLLLFSALVAWLSWPVTRRGLRWWELLAVTAATTIGFGMHHYMILLSGAFGLFLLVRGQALRPRSWAWLATQVVAFAVFAGWLYLTRDRLGNVAGTEKPSFALWIPYTFFTYVAGFSFGPSTRDIQEAGGHVRRMLLPHLPGIALLAASAGVLLAAGLRRLLRPDRRDAGMWLAIWLVAPILIAVLATQVTNIRYNVRYVIVCYPALMLLFAAGIRWAWCAMSPRGATVGEGPRWFAVVTLAAGAGLAGCMATSDVRHFTDDHYAKEDVRALSAALARLPAETVIVSDNNRVVKVLAYYHGRLPAPALQVDYRTPLLTPARVWANLVALPPAQRRDIALVEYRSWETDPAGTLHRNIAGIARPVAVQRFPGVTLTRFAATRDGTAR